MGSIEPVIKYVEAQLERTASLLNMSDADIVGLLSGSGGSQIDVVFYVISQSKASTQLLRMTPSYM